MASSSKGGKSDDPIKSDRVDREAGDFTLKNGSSGSSLPDEYDHRGIRLPARTRVGGIIIPQ
jgi:hypothetical protein